MTTWKEIQRLAADLQRVQLAEGVKRLSENNSIELVTKLMSDGLIDIVIGKDASSLPAYITRKYLVTEVKNECMANDNRIALIELASRLSVELDHVEGAVGNLMKQSDSFILCAGELIHRDYINDLCEKVNARLHDSGQISMLQLTKNWDLSTEVINNYLLAEIGHRIRAVKLDDQVYTPVFLDVSKRKLGAILSALTKVLPIYVIHAHLNVSQLLFFKIWNELWEEGSIPGQLLGGKNSLKSLYLPNIHLQNVRSLVKKTLLELNFIDGSVLKKLSVVDSAAFLKECCSKADYENLLFLPSAIIDRTLWDDLEQAVEGNIMTSQFCVIEHSLPQSLSNCLTSADNEKIVNLLLKTHSNWKVAQDSSVVYDPSLLKQMVGAVEEFCKEKAKADAPSIFKALKSTKRPTPPKKATMSSEEDWGSSNKGNKKKAGKKGAAGATKSKATNDDNQEGHSTTLQREDLLTELNKSPLQIPEELVEELAEELESAANAIYRESVENALQLVNSLGAEEQRRSHEENLLKLRQQYTAICVFEEGASNFEEKLADDLKQYLLRSLCTEFSNAVLTTFVDNVNVSSMSPKARTEAIAAIGDAELREPVKNLFDCMQTMEKLHEAVFGLRGCSLLIKQPDKTSRFSV